MKGNFGIWPKLALLVILGAFIINKFQVADSDLKDFKADRAAHDQFEPIAAPTHIGPLTVESPATTTSVIPLQAQKIPAKPQSSLLDNSEVCKTSLKFQSDPIPIAYSQTDVPPTINVDEPETPAPAEESSGGFWGLLKTHWGVILSAFLVFIESIIRVTPSNKDNSIFSFIKFILDKIIPNARSGGGTHV